MNSAEALQRVREIYAQNGWVLGEYVSVFPDTISIGSIFARRKKKIWVVDTNTNLRGGNGHFEFDDETGALLEQVVFPK